MNVYKISPRNWMTPRNDSSKRLSTPAYYVFFWTPTKDGHFARECFKLVGAGNVAEAILWQESNENSRLSALLLPVTERTENGTKYTSLYLLNGVYPEGLEVESNPDFGWTMSYPDQ